MRNMSFLNFFKLVALLSVAPIYAHSSDQKPVEHFFTKTWTNLLCPLEPKDISENQKISLEKLSNFIFENIHQQSFGEDYSEIFNTNYDWHSSVHAHWAALNSARVLEKKAQEEYIVARLNEDAIIKEFKFLQKNPDFELPYGRAWLLLLISELEKLKSSPNLTTIKTYLAESVYDYLNRNKKNKSLLCLGSHQSWVFADFLLQKSGAINLLSLEKIQILKMTREKLPCDFSNSLSSYDFLNLPDVLGAEDVVLKSPSSTTFKSLSDRILSKQKIRNPNECHLAGALATTTWQRARKTSKNNLIACLTFKQNILDLLENESLWKNDFDCVGHWVPQFIWFGYWLALGQP